VGVCGWDVGKWERKQASQVGGRTHGVGVLFWGRVWGRCDAKDGFGPGLGVLWGFRLVHLSATVVCGGYDDECGRAIGSRDPCRVVLLQPAGQGAAQVLVYWRFAIMP
jgi:hypothetical protein